MGNTPEDSNKIYRLDLLEDRTHKKIRSIRFSKIKMVSFLVTTLVILAGLVYCLIAYTPIKTTIPGYPDVSSKNQAIENAIRIDSLESVILRWELFAGNLERVLSGDPTINLDSLVSGIQTRYLKDVSSEEVALQDSLLRKKIGGK